MGNVYPYSDRLRGVLTYLAQYEDERVDENTIITLALTKYFEDHRVSIAPKTIGECVEDYHIGYMTILADGKALCQVKE